MNALIEFLSGEVPGGLLLLLLILLIINLSLFFFYKGSKFFTKEVYQRKVIKSSGFVLVIYVTIWFVLRPVPVPDSILFLPFQNGENCNFAISELLEKQIEGNISEDFRLHNWEWFYETCNTDSIDSSNYRIDVAIRLNVDLIITGYFLDESKITIRLISKNENFEREFEFNSFQNLSLLILNWIDGNHQILKNKGLIGQDISDDYITKLAQSKILYLNSDFNKALKVLEYVHPEPAVLKSKIYLELGKIE